MLKDIMKSRQADINARLSEILRSDVSAHDTLFASMNYSLSAGGKRIRPFLFLLVLELFHKDWRKYLDVACALECVHTYSLIHDDLPAMDNDDYRRGKPTNHKKYGAGMATMAGDGLLTFAFELLAEEETIPPAARCELISILAKAAGPTGMVGGQAHDIEAEGQTLTLEDLRLMDHCKTGCLLMAPVDMAALLADISEKERGILHRFAAHLGILFQITDDLLDVNGHLDEMGKMPHQDEADHKSTYVTILGKEAAEKLAQEEAAAAKALLAEIPEDTTLLAELAEMILVRKK